MSDELLTRKELAEWLRVSARYLYRLESTGDLPKPLLIGSRKRWSKATVMKWMERKQGSGSRNT